MDLFLIDLQCTRVAPIVVIGKVNADRTVIFELADRFPKENSGDVTQRCRAPL